MLSGDNGILQKATEAKTKTDDAQIKEKVQLAYLGALADGKGEVTEEVLTTALNSEFGAGNYTLAQDLSKVTIDEKDYYFDGTSSGNSSGENGGREGSTHTETLSNGIEVAVPIPNGFTKSTVTGETSVENGLVVKDLSLNEYIWIPVFKYDSSKCTWGANYSSVASTTEDSDAYYTAIETALKNYTATYKNASYTDVWYGDSNYGQYGYYDGSKFVYYTNGNMTQSEYTALYHGMLKSVYENGGFYIGRYEMGIAVVDNITDASTNTRVSVTEYTPSTSTSGSTDTSSANAVSISGMTAPLSKANAVAYTKITQSQAEMLAEMLDYSGLTSSLMFGVQWDAVCVYLEHYAKVDNSATASAGTSFNSSYLTNNTYGKLWGNYKNAKFKMNQGFYSTTYNNTTAVTWNVKSVSAKETSTEWLCTTGASNQNKVCNIYDFAGNLAEYSLERSSSGGFPCVVRGSYFHSNGYASGWSNDATTYRGYNTSSRVSLYISSHKN